MAWNIVPGPIQATRLVATGVKAARATGGVAKTGAATQSAVKSAAGVSKSGGTVGVPIKPIIKLVTGAGKTVGKTKTTTKTVAPVVKATKPVSQGGVGARVKGTPVGKQFGPKRPTAAQLQQGLQQVAARNAARTKNLHGKGGLVASKGAITVTAVAGAGTLLALPASKMSKTSGTSTRQKYSSMKPGAEKVRTGPGKSYVGSTVGARPTGTPMSNRSATSGTVSAAIKQGRAQGPTKSQPTKTQPSQRKGDSSRKSTGGGQSRRTKMVAERLRLAEDAARSGNVVAAANYAKAAANIQKKGQGSAKSMKRVQRVARTYSRAAKGSE
jgi:hypothetical protein